jgi:hypothetical protein
MPIYWRRFHPWPHSDWESRVDKDDEDNNHPTGLPTLHSKVQCVYAPYESSPSQHYSADRYEKRHKNLAAHVSPAFRVELGDTVTVGA